MEEEITDLKRESEEVLAAMLGDAEVAPEPGSLRPRDIIHQGDEELPPPIVTSVLTSAGWRYIYDRETGERSLTNVNMLPAQLRKRREDGSLIFTVQKPKTPPVRGTLKCLLHPDDPNRAEYARFGFAACRKANLVSSFHVDRHMQSRHKVEWQTIRKAKEEAREAEQWALQKTFLQRAAENEAKTAAKRS